MDKDKILDEIFNNDPLGLLSVKPKTTQMRSADERLVASFDEINAFVSANGKEPEANPNNVSEYVLYSRLKNLRDEDNKISQLRDYDKHRLFPPENMVGETTGNYHIKKDINSIEDMLDDDILDILSDDVDELFDFKHTPKNSQRIKTDFVARRKPCKDFTKYEENFKQVQDDLAHGRRKLLPFGMGHLKVDNYYVHNGLLFYLESVEFDRKDYYRKDGTRVREDGRTHCIFENGTESNMLFRSVSKVLYANGKTVSPNIKQANAQFENLFNNISDEDKLSGYIYVLKSLSTDKQISQIADLYKIGYSKNDVRERIKNAEVQPTYLMAAVKIVNAWQCYNLNPQKLEQLLHNFFGNSCLELDVFDKYGKKHHPREWFIAPFDIIQDAIELVISGEIINYKYDEENLIIVKKETY